jgi:hypothetical protein
MSHFCLLNQITGEVREEQCYNCTTLRATFMFAQNQRPAVGSAICKRVVRVKAKLP